MRAYILDVETVPLAESELIKLMPPEVSNPVMPESLRNPPPVDLSKCPVYGGSEEKQNAWKASQTAKHARAAEEARDEWEEKAIGAKQRFIEDAALSPLSATVKLIGIKDHESGIAYVAVAGATAEEKRRCDEGAYPCKVELRFWEDEKSMLWAFSSQVNAGFVVDGNQDGSSGFKLVTFFGNGFDFPFLFKRCWMLGTLAPWMLRKGRYWNSDISADLHELWTFGDRSQKTGGLDNFAKILGTKRKTGTGEQFYKLWQSDCVAAVSYLCDDLTVTEEAATKMGVIYAPKPPSEKKGKA
jgi:hypothetical protein